MTNFEFKAHLRHPERVLECLQRLRADHLGEMQQTDTYFHVTSGRLKLREIENLFALNASLSRESQLIFYQRADDLSIKRSEYQIIPVADPQGMIALLGSALGIRVVVKKSRSLYLLAYDHAAMKAGKPGIRVHLDKVEGLGDFLEVEAVVGDGVFAEDADMAARALLRDFGVGTEDLISGSYADLLIARG